MAKAKLTQSFLAGIKPDHVRHRVRQWDTEVPGFFVSVLRSGRITFYLKYRFEGVPRELPLGVYGAITATQARKLARKTAGEVAAGKDPHTERRRRKAERIRQRQATLGAFIEHVYAPYLLTERKDGAAALARMKACFGQWYSMPMQDINEFRVMRWRQGELQRGLANSSINRSVTLLKACLNQAERVNIIDRNPIRQLRRLKEDRLGIARYLSRDQENALRKALADRDEQRASARRRANKWRSDRRLPPYPEIPARGYSDYLTPLVLLAINTGLRRAELFHLKWKHVNPDFKALTVVAKNAKSRSTRYVALNTEAESILRYWRDQTTDNPLVFPSAKTGGPLTDIKRAWTAVREAAGISDFRFHDLRHHFASRLVMKGVPLNTVRDLLGHSDLNMTLRYAHLAPSHRAEAVALLVRG